MKKIDVNTSNLIKCLQTKYCAYLLSDALLKDALETGVYNSKNVLQVYLDDFVCVKKEHNAIVKDIGGPFYVVPGKSDFPAHAQRFGLCCPTKSNNNLVETFLDGHLHLAWFIDDELKWAVKNLILCESMKGQEGDVFYLVNPRFLATGIIDRWTSTESERGKRVIGWAPPALSADTREQCDSIDLLASGNPISMLRD